MPRRRPPLLRPARPDPAPGEHLRALTELLKASGAEDARRWVAALLRLDPAQRGALIGEAERRAAGVPPELTVVHPPRARNGYVEQVERTYEVKPARTDGATRRNRAQGG